MQDAQPTAQPAAAAPAAPNLLFRSDTILGVCEGLGEDLGINANILRVAFCVMLFFYPIGTVGTYFALGAVIALSRLIYPRPQAAAALHASSRRPAEAANEEGTDSGRLAA